jgi:ribosomal protein S18 acetylase RimI-like enzyme
VTADVLVYRRIDPAADAELAYANYRDACIASYGDAARCINQSSYVRWLAQRVDEFPDGHVLAMLASHGNAIVGQLELQVPYGLRVGYVNLFHVTRDWRRFGFGRRLHQEFAECYFRSWEADTIELHVSPTNHAATQFYRSLGYTLASVENPSGDRMWRMQRRLERAATAQR